MNEVTTFLMMAVIVLPILLVIMILLQFLGKPSHNTKANENNKLIQNAVVQSQSKNESDEAKSANFDDSKTNAWAARGAGAGLVLGAMRGFFYDPGYGDIVENVIMLSVGGAFFGALISTVGYLTLSSATDMAAKQTNPFMQGAMFVLFTIVCLAALGLGTGILPAMLFRSEY